MKCSNLGLSLKRTTGKSNKAKKKTASKMKMHETKRQGSEEDQSAHLQQQSCMPLQEAADCSKQTGLQAVRECKYRYHASWQM